ncbi:MAG: hypothetical protein ACPGYV_12175 [Phycisphaeraceae bacterium]
MLALQTVILEHQTAQGIHHDWLIEDPSLSDPQAAAARLWTARIAPPPHLWPTLRRFELTVIPPHRRHYLTYQGPVSNHRGHVKRVLQGRCLTKQWTRQCILLTLQSEAITINLRLDHQANHHWIATQP